MDFIRYVIDYYQEFSRDVGGVPVTREEVSNACEILMAIVEPEWDSVDRERVRDIILLTREHKNEGRVRNRT